MTARTIYFRSWRPLRAHLGPCVSLPPGRAQLALCRPPLTRLPAALRQSAVLWQRCGRLAVRWTFASILQCNTAENEYMCVDVISIP